MVIFMFKSYGSAQLNQVHQWKSDTCFYYVKVYNLAFLH